MCGRYTLSASHEALARAFLAEFAEELKASWKPRYNIAPGAGVVAVLADRDRGGRRADILHWGLVPHWAKDPSIGYKMINARAETVAAKPAYRDPFRYRRCLIPASGFYEWDRRASPGRPFYFHPREGGFFAMAGVWDHWLHPSGSEILSVAIITTAADKTVAPVHHRMPVILQPRDWDRWLDPANVRAAGLESLLAPARDSILKSHPVSTAVNKADVDAPSLIEEVEQGWGGQLDLFG